MTQIIHYADVQVKNRDKNLFKVYQSTLKEIESIIKNKKTPIVIISGDLFEYPVPNDSERKLINNHLSRLLKISTVKELIVIAGNHDLIKDKKQIEHNSNFNPISIFNDMLEELDSDKHTKLIYIKESKIYQSKYNEKINYIGYSLEDNEAIDLTNLDKTKTNICIYHGMIKEYVDKANIPLRKDIYTQLKSVEDFPENSLIFAGDIHENLIFEGINFQKFYYPGSTTQHTHKEGNYYNISENIIYKYGEPKCLNYYDFEEKTFSKIELKNPIQYNTIELDYKIPIPIILNNLNNLDLKIGDEKTYLKIKTSNIFISIEKEIFDLFHKKFNIKNIAFEYDKFVNQTNLSSNNKVIDKIIEEKNLVKTKFNSDIITNENIDDLILNENQLIQLFESVLTDILEKTKNEFDEFTIEDIKKDILSLFSKELNLSSNFSSKRYNIELFEIETNGFMSLCENKILLNIPGIIRIIGTNGIGKTTLYNMLRWVTIGDVFDGMSKNSVIKNNLIVFNKNKPENDFVSVKLSMKVNSQFIQATRSVTRKWKNNVTDEQKISVNWKDFISSVEREFYIDVFNESNESKRYSGDNAEKSIKVWFGKSIENILFLNQSKIENILSLNSEKLNELILEFIGVDYLNKLENNLDIVKNELNKPKPKRNSEDIKNAIIDNKIFINKCEEKIENQKLINIDLNNEISELNLSIENINESLINLGNIPQLIENIDKKIFNIETELNKPIEEKQKLTLFEKEKPILDDDTILKYNNQINENNIISDNYNIEFNNNINKIDLLYKDIGIEIKNNIDILNNDKIYYEKKISDNNNEIKQIYNKIFKDCETKCTEYQTNEITYLTKIKKEFEPISLFIEKKLKSLKDKKIELITENTELLTTNKQINQEIENIRNRIKSGICSYCGSIIKQGDKTDEEWELEKENFEKSIDTNLQKITFNDETVNANNELIKKLNTYIGVFELLKVTSFDLNIDVFENDIIFTNFQNVKENIINLQLEKSSNLENLSIIQNFMLKFQNNLDFFKNSNLFVSEYNKIVEYNNDNVNIETNFVNTYHNKINQYNNVLNIKYNIDDYSFLDCEDKSENWIKILKIVENYKLLKESNEELSTKINLNKKLIDTLNSEIALIKNNYTIDLEKYQKEYEENIKINEQIRKFNNEIDIKLLDNEKNKLELVNLNNEKLNYINQKIKFDELSDNKKLLNDKLSENQKKLDEYNNLLNEYNFKLIQFKNQKDLLDKEYLDYVDYIKNNVIWKIYSSLIKNSFKEIVFEYYRNFLNNTLNYLLENVNFKLFWNRDSELIHLSTNNNKITYQPVQQSSGMETCFLGLSLIYTMHLLNVKNSVSHLFIDEISGTLNSGTELSYEANNYKELLVLLLNKFSDKKVFIIDHNIDNLFETSTYEVRPTENGSKYFN